MDFYRMVSAPARHQEAYGIFGATLKTGSRGFDLQERIERFPGYHFFRTFLDFYAILGTRLGSPPPGANLPCGSNLVLLRQLTLAAL